MGGAIAYLTARKSESAWTGVVFSGPGALKGVACGMLASPSHCLCGHLHSH